MNCIFQNNNGKLIFIFIYALYFRMKKYRLKIYYYENQVIFYQYITHFFHIYHDFNKFSSYFHSYFFPGMIPGFKTYSVLTFGQKKAADSLQMGGSKPCSHYAFRTRPPQALHVQTDFIHAFVSFQFSIFDYKQTSPESQTLITLHIFLSFCHGIQSPSFNPSRRNPRRSPAGVHRGSGLRLLL